MAVLKKPVLLNKSAAAPTAVFSIPVPALWSPTLSRSAAVPTAVLKLPSVFLQSVKPPRAVFHWPVVRLNSAFCPSAVLNFGYRPSGGGTTACAIGLGPKQARPTAVRGAKTSFVIVFIYLFSLVVFFLWASNTDALPIIYRSEATVWGPGWLSAS